MNTTKQLKMAGVAGVAVLGVVASAVASHDYPFQLPAITNATVTGGFWLPRIETNRTVTLKSDFKNCETARIPNFRNAAARKWGTFKGIPFDDSDVYKVIEGAAYSLATNPDPELEKYVDGVNRAIVGAQEPDGYLYTARTLGFTYKNQKTGEPEFRMMGPVRWSHLAHSHELYNVGHFYEAAVAYYEATGKRTLLDAAIRSADLIDRVFGTGPTQLKGTSGHEEIELALCKLYRATGDAKYLKLAKHLLDMRGRNTSGKHAKVFTQSGDLADGTALDAPGSYCQDHMPVTEQREAVGHAVRAAYLYCGMADVGALAGNADYIKAIDAIWENVVRAKLALNGSVGSRHRGEAFGANYELPNETAYLETCAGIGNALWNERMFLLHGEAKYIDVVELAIYNGVISGVSLSGDEFFYPNPLASFGGYRRSKWFGCSCCPVNVVRFIPQVPQFAYAMRGNSAYVNLFIEGNATLKLDCGNLKVSQKTDYPRSGNVRIAIEPPKDGARFALNVRIPGWCVGRPVPSDLYTQVEPGTFADFSAKVNGKAVKVVSTKGYCVIDREWSAGDVVEVSMNMPVRRIKAHDKVEADRARLAVMRGPVLYCAEGIDNGRKAFKSIIPADATFSEGELRIGAERYTSLLSSNGVTLVPYCVWGNREPGNDMQTWFAVDIWGGTDRVISFSNCFYLDGPEGLLKRVKPSSSADIFIRRLTFWPQKGTKEWVACDFKAPRKVSGTKVYWFDDTTRNGGCALPESWSVEWRESDSSEWRTVEAVCPVLKDGFCEVKFPEAVTVKSVRLNIKLKDRYSCGILAWEMLP